MKRKRSAPTRKSIKVAKTVDTPIPSSFDNLPREIWHEIGSHLEPSDKAALTLTCQSSFACFGADVVKTLNLPSQRVERLKLLFRLHQWFPEHYLCGECNVYHRGQGDEDFEAADFVISAFSNMEWSLDWSLASTIADNLRNAKCTAGEAAKRMLPHCRVAFVNGRVILDIRGMVPLTIRALQEDAYSAFRACTHAPTSTTLMAEADKALAAAPRPWEPLKTYKYQSPIFRCPYCPTEFRFYSSVFKGEALIAQKGARFGLVIHRMIDLGRFLSPHDRNWAVLTQSRYAGVVETVPYDIGSSDGIMKQYASFTGASGLLDSPVLPLLD